MTSMRNDTLYTERSTYDPTAMAAAAADSFVYDEATAIMAKYKLLNDIDSKAYLIDSYVPVELYAHVKST